MGYMYLLLVNLFVIILNITVCYDDQIPAVNFKDVLVTLQPQTVIEGDSATLTCNFESIPGLTFQRLTWFRTDSKVILNNSTNYDTYSVLQLSKVNFIQDSGNYTCDVEYLDPSSLKIPNNESQALLTVQVPLENVFIFEQNSQRTTDTSYVIAGEVYQFTCVVPNINPAASIKWTLGNNELEGAETTSKINESGLITTYSTVELPAAWENHNEVLGCDASQIKGWTNISTNVTLDVKVLPTKSSLSLFNDIGPLADGDTVKIQPSLYKHHIFFEVIGTRPKVFISCSLGEERLHPYERTSGGEENELTNTSIVFIESTESHHNKQLKCNVSSAYSKDSPLIQVTLHVAYDDSRAAPCLAYQIALGFALAIGVFENCWLWWDQIKDSFMKQVNKIRQIFINLHHHNVQI